MTSRRLAFAFLLSVALHAAVVLELRRATVPESRLQRAPIVLRDLRILTSPASRRAGDGAEAEAPPASQTAARPRGAVVVRESPAASLVPTPNAAPDAPTRRQGGGVASAFWQDHALTAFLQKCREGEAPRDSILDPAPTAHEVALARTIDQLNETAWSLHATWNRERFAEAFRRNFPNMQ